MDLLIIGLVLLTVIAIWYCSGLLTKILLSFSVKDHQELPSLMHRVYSSKMGMLFMSTFLMLIIGYASWTYYQTQEHGFIVTKNLIKNSYDTTQIWQAPPMQYILQDKNKDLILYGRQLIAHTSEYLGPKGVVKPMSNGMNCQNCHLDAGTKPFGNNYSAVAATYPKFRTRSGSFESISKRVNDCFQRSLNGDSLMSSSKEMRAITAYLQWLGQAVPKHKSPLGVGLYKVKPMPRAADPVRGKQLYSLKCQSCHGADGEGLAKPENTSEYYPPLWGDHSYNEGAGLYRLSSFAGYIKTNMPFGATADNPQLTDEESWDLAAFVNSQPRPKHKFLAVDWPLISKKTYDHPFGPFADSFPEHQHKYGPFLPIIDFQNSKTK